MAISRACLLTALCMALPPTLHAAPLDGSMVAQADGLTVHDAWARASAGAATTGAAYVMVMGGSQPDQLIGASSPVAATAEVHQTLTENGVMKMRPAPNLPIPAGQMVTFAPGGTHIMLMGLKHPLAAGQTFPLTLTFAHAGPITVDVAVRGVGHGANSGMGGHDAMPMR